MELDLTFLSLFQVWYTHLTRKKTQHHGTVRTLLLPSFCVRFLLCAQPCLNNYKCIACTCTSTHSFVGLISSVISTTSRFSIFYFFFFWCSFSFLFFPYTDAGKVHPASKKQLPVHIAGGSELYSSILLLLDLCRNNERKMRWSQTMTSFLTTRSIPPSSPSFTASFALLLNS